MSEGPGDWPVLDEEFVRQGKVELSAKQRATAAARRQREERVRRLSEERAPGRAQARRARAPRSRLTWVLVGVVVAAGGWAALGHPGVGSNPDPAAATKAANAASASDATTDTTTNRSTTSTTLQTLLNFDYAPGTCVTWDQSAGDRAITEAVPCAAPHLVESVGAPFQIEGFGTAYPPGEALDSYLRSKCLGPAQAYLGHAIDPNGRFFPGAIRPTPDSWAEGERTAHCAIQLAGATDQRMVAFTGEVRGADQEYLYPVGACGFASGVVDCSQPHFLQVVGDVALAPSTPFPSSDTAWARLADADCGTMALRFLGGSYPAGVHPSEVVLSETSWSSGERTLQCTVATFPAGGGPALMTTGSLAAKG